MLLLVSNFSFAVSSIRHIDIIILEQLLILESENNLRNYHMIINEFWICCCFWVCKNWQTCEGIQFDIDRCFKIHIHRHHDIFLKIPYLSQLLSNYCCWYLFHCHLWVHVLCKFTNIPLAKWIFSNNYVVNDLSVSDVITFNTIFRHYMFYCLLFCCILSNPFAILTSEFGL